MKYISFAIPCYNSEAYMEKAINSILAGGEDVEIIVVNDGSRDGTQEIAEKYQEKYPTIVKAVKKENGGHGDAVNCGLQHATGKYFKVVDSDDWVDRDALNKILDAVKGFVDADSPVDMIISNYVYEKVGMTNKKVIRYDNVLPENQIFRWDDIGRFRLDQYILMHSVIYRTDMLRLCQLKLFCDLPDRYAPALPAQAAEAYVLCRQYLCILSAAACPDSVLPECGFLQIFYRT